MPSPRRRTLYTLAFSCLGLALAAAGANAQKALERGSDLHALARESARLTPAPDVDAVAANRSAVRLDSDLALSDFGHRHGGTWTAHFDKRTGDVSSLEGSGLAWFPGRGNKLRTEDVAGFLGGKSTPDLAAHDRRARAFLPEVAQMLDIDAANLKLNLGRSGSPAPHVWFVDYDVTVDGKVVEGARVVLTINNGNLVAIGTENLPGDVRHAPRAAVNAAQAKQVVADYLGGFLPGDRFVDKGSYHLLPSNNLDARFDAGYEPGRGRGVAGVWQLTFNRPGQVGTFRARVDASTGELLEFVDVNEYGSATGGTYQSDRPATERVLPLPFANVASGVYTNSAGIFSGTTGTTTLAGQYVKITDSCGAISKAADASGVLALGSSTGTDCTTPGSGGAGNTHAARTQFYAVNRAKEVARGWLPSNSWINAQLTANVNLNQTCNAYWNGSTLNFFKSGGGCANTGELPGVSLHEYGHGLDTNDGSGSSPDNGTGETYGDFTAALATHASCIGAGFLTSNCGGYGNSCSSCTGVRDIDWAKHSRNTASTVDNFTRTTCPQPSANNPNYVGVCGKDAIARGVSTNKREGHCESVVSSEALWDLANRDMTNPGSGAAWTIVDRLWYLSRSTASGAFQCNTSAATWTSNGCNTGSLFKIFRAVDDDNGNLADGTPHGAAIAAAMNRHGMACTTDAAWNVSFSAVAAPAVPALSITAGNNSAALSWSGSSGVYDVYRNETSCNAGFTKVANDVATTSYTDNAVANGITYYYQVVAQPSGNEAAASAPSTCQHGDAGLRSLHAAGGAHRARRHRRVLLADQPVVDRLLGRDLVRDSPLDHERRSVLLGRHRHDDVVLEYRPHRQHDLLLRRDGVERHLQLRQLGAGLGHHAGRAEHGALERRSGDRHLGRHEQPADLDHGGPGRRHQPQLRHLGGHRRRRPVRPVRLGADDDHLRLPSLPLRQQRDLQLRHAADGDVLRDAGRLRGVLGRQPDGQLHDQHLHAAGGPDRPHGVRRLVVADQPRLDGFLGRHLVHGLPLDHQRRTVLVGRHGDDDLVLEHRPDGVDDLLLRRLRLERHLRLGQLGPGFGHHAVVGRRRHRARRERRLRDLVVAVGSRGQCLLDGSRHLSACRHRLWLPRQRQQRQRHDVPADRRSVDGDRHADVLAQHGLERDHHHDEVRLPLRRGAQYLGHAARHPGDLQQPRQGRGGDLRPEEPRPGGLQGADDPLAVPGHDRLLAGHDVPGGRRLGEVRRLRSPLAKGRASARPYFSLR